MADSNISLQEAQAAAEAAALQAEQALKEAEEARVAAEEKAEIAAHAAESAIAEKAAEAAEAAERAAKAQEAAEAARVTAEQAAQVAAEVAANAANREAEAEQEKETEQVNEKTDDIPKVWSPEWGKEHNMSYMDWRDAKAQQIAELGYIDVDEKKLEEAEVFRKVGTEAMKRQVRKFATSISVPAVLAVAGASVATVLTGGAALPVLAGVVAGAGIGAAGTARTFLGALHLGTSPEMLGLRIDRIEAKRAAAVLKYQREISLESSPAAQKRAKMRFEKESAKLDKQLAKIYNQAQKAKTAYLAHDGESYNPEAGRVVNWVNRRRGEIGKICTSLGIRKLEEKNFKIRSAYDNIACKAESVANEMAGFRENEKMKKSTVFESGKKSALKTLEENAKVDVKNFKNEELLEKCFVDGKIDSKKVLEIADKQFKTNVNAKTEFLARAFSDRTFPTKNMDDVTKIVTDMLKNPKFAELVDNKAFHRDAGIGIAKLAAFINEKPQMQTEIAKIAKGLSKEEKAQFNANYQNMLDKMTMSQKAKQEVKNKAKTVKKEAVKTGKVVKKKAHELGQQIKDNLHNNERTTTV